MFERCGAASILGDLSQEEFVVWAGFVQTHAAIARGLDADLRAAHGLALSEFEILLWLSHESCARMRMAELADTVQLSPSGLSRAIERLEARGLVTRHRFDDDRRGAFARLTESGADLLQRAGATQAAGIRRRFLERMTAEELRAFGPAWVRVLAANERSCLWSGSAGEEAPHPLGVCESEPEGHIAKGIGMSAPQVSPAEIKTHQERVVAEFRANSGRVGGAAEDVPLLLLTTTGAKSGQPRTMPVSYTRDFSRYVIIAAKQGAPTNPGWYHNLVANPIVTVEVGDERFQAIARVAKGAERQRLFDQMAAVRPNFIEFQKRTSRQLPVIVLERALDQSTDYDAFNRNFIEEFHARGGKVGGIFEGLPVLLLTTIGAKSGQRRIAPVLYGEDNGNPVVVASKGGSPTHPDWYHNLVANPKVTVDLGTESFPAHARVAEGAERRRLFDALIGVIPKLEETQARTTRQLPIVVLERTD